MSTRLPGDPGGMMNAVSGLADQFARGASAVGSLGTEFRARSIRTVLVCGMGGSAFPGDFLALYARRFGVTVTVSRDYEVRETALDPSVLAIVSSYSGDTEETLSAFEQVRAAGCAMVAVSAGGRLEALARTHDVPHVRFVRPDPHFQPRAAMGDFFGAFTTLLHNAGLLPDVPAMLTRLSAHIRALHVDGDARALANQLWDRIPVIYATDPFTQTAARVIKIKLNENAKMPAFFNGLPELDHNELVGFTRLTGPFSAVLLRPPGLSVAMARRFEVTAETLVSVGVPALTVDLPDADPEVQLFTVLHLFDVVSVHIALRAGIDPTPVAMVEDFKRRLAERAAAQRVSTY
jgi:glucose/mannose-6-phosphate isomerase